MKKHTSLMVLAAALAAFLAAPAMAQTSGGGDHMKGMKAASSTKKPMKMAKKSKHKMSCYDYAWQSQDMKDCLAKSGKSM